MNYIILDPNGLNFLTITIVDWIDLFTRKVYRDIVLESLEFCQKQKGLNVCAYVIMPSHLHLIVQTDNPLGLAAIIRTFKSFTATQILNYIKNRKLPESRREWLLNRFAFNARKNRRNADHQIWQYGNHPIALYSPKVIRQKLFYIHNNPVIEGMVFDPTQYPYSSAINYSGKNGLLEVQILDCIWNDIGFLNL